MREYDAWLLDSDGTVIDSHSLICGSFSYTFRELFGIDLDHRQHIVPVLGHPLRVCYSMLGEFFGMQFSPRDLENHCLMHDAYQNENLHLASAFDGMIPALEQAKKAGIKRAIVTARTYNARLMLENAGVSPLIDFVVTGDDVKNSKPHPEALNKALAALRIPPSRAIMMGDTIVDIEAGRNAGCKTIGVTYGSAGEEIALYQPTYTINHPLEAIGIILGK